MFVWDDDAGKQDNSGYTHCLRCQANISFLLIFSRWVRRLRAVQDKLALLTSSFSPLSLLVLQLLSWPCLENSRCHCSVQHVLDGVLHKPRDLSLLSVAWISSVCHITVTGGMWCSWSGFIMLPDEELCCLATPKGRKIVQKIIREKIKSL